MSKKTEAKQRYLNSEEGRYLSQVIRARGVPVERVSDSVLPDDYEFEGAKVVDGKFCRTGKEYKEALERQKNWGWSCW